MSRRKVAIARRLALMMTLACGGFAAASASALQPLNPDTDPSRILWSALPKRLGPLPAMSERRYGAVLKTLSNPYWNLLAAGYQEGCRKFNCRIVVQAAADEHDQLVQLSIMESMVVGGYQGLLISPQTNANLQPGLIEARWAGIPIVDVDDAVLPAAEHFVGNIQRDNGVRAARWFISHHPGGGKLAIIEGQAGVFAAAERTAGFEDTINASGRFIIVGTVPANWSRQEAYDAAAALLQQHPDLIGFYCNNDTMALGVVESVKSAGLMAQVSVIGTDGTTDALASIRAGELTGSVASFPQLTGEVAIEVLQRLEARQKIPRVVTTPQVLVTKDNIKRYMGDLPAVRAALIEDERGTNDSR